MANDQFSAKPVVPVNNTVPGEGSGKVVNTTSSNFLPQYYNTETNKRFLTNTLDQLISKGSQEQINLYVGKKSGTVYKPNTDFYLKETRQDRADYQLEVGVVTKDIDGNVTSTISYDDILQELRSNWPYTKPDQFDTEYYSYTPPIDYDKFVNFSSYNWMKLGLPGIMIEGDINVEADIIGKISYTTPVQRNGKTISLQNGMKIYFVNSAENPLGLVVPNWYVSEKTPVLTNEDGQPLMTVEGAELMSTNEDAEPTYFIVEGVGEAIILVPADQMDGRIPGSLMAPVEWDSVPWDRKKWDTAEPAPAEKAYVVIQRGSVDQNAWSRINNWYHVNTIKDVYNYIGLNPADYLSLSNRGNRPIIEFKRDTQLYNSGYIPSEIDADFVWYGGKISDFNFKTSVTIDGVEIEPGSKVLFINSPDAQINNKLIRLYFMPDDEGINHYYWQEVENFPAPVAGQKLFIQNGTVYKYQEMTFNGTDWYLGQNLNYRNQQPLFVMYDADGVRLDNTTKYPDTDFRGCTIFEYKTGDFYDNELGIKVSIESSNYDIVSSTSPFSKTFTNLFFNNTASNFNYYKNSKGLRDEIPGSYYWRTVDGFTNTVKYENGWVRNAEPPKTFQRLSKIVTDVTSQNSIIVPSDAEATYTFAATIKEGKVRFYVLSKNNEWVPFDWSTNMLTLAKNKEFMIYNFTGQEFFNVRLDGAVPPGVANESETVYGIPQSTGIWSYSVAGITGYINVIEPKTDTRTLKVRINGQDTLDYTTEQVDVGLQVNITDDNLAVEDLVEVLFESVTPAGTYAIHSTLEANANNDKVGTFTYSDILSHFKSKITNQSNFEGSGYGLNNYHKIVKDTGTGWVVQQQVSPLTKLAVLLRNNVTLPNNALQYGAEQSKLFRQKFINKLTSLNSTLDVTSKTVRELVYESLIAINIGKNSDFPFAFSDMLYYVDSDAKSIKTYTAENSLTFSLGTTIDISDPYRDHVYVYANDEQLLIDKDYTLTNTTVTIISSVPTGATIKIVVQSNLGNCYVPVSPAKLGLTGVYTPELYTDSTTDTDFIICHDGSMIVAFGDYRDAVILELEKSIYNNIYSKFRQSRNKWLGYEPGAYRPTRYSKAIRYSYVGDRYRLWRLQNGVNDNSNAQFYNEDNPFTWNYIGVSEYGSWRDMYRHLFDTDRPHTHPWEMLGYTNKPTWWDNYYGWDDLGKRSALLTALATGNIAEPPAINIDLLVRRDVSMIPVGENGELLDPVTAGICEAPSAEQAQYDWEFGQLGNQEMAWVRSSEYPWVQSQWHYSVQPNVWLEQSWEPERNGVDSYNTQSINTSLGRRSQLADLYFHREYKDNTFHVRYGFQHILAENLLQEGVDLTTNFYDNIRYANTQMLLKLGGFANKSNLSFLADTLKIQEGSNFIPEEDYQLVLHRGTSYKEFFYSGVKVIWNGTGYEVHGYNLINPFFICYQPTSSTRYKEILYNGIKVKEAIDWEKAPSIVDYGTTFMSRQAVWNFLIGYGKWLADQGLAYEDFDNTLGGIRDFNLAARQFLFWSESKWDSGYSIILSPCANQIVFNSEVGWAEDLNTTIRGYANILDKDQAVIPTSDITFERSAEGKNVIKTRANYTGIYGLRLRFNELEHMVVFNNETIFNDVVYNPLYRLKQYRFKLIGSRTPNWTGRPKTPGYMVYGNTLISNFDRTVSDISDRYFSVEGHTENKSLVETARHSIGVTNSDYLRNIVLDETVAFEFQRGMLHQKGTPSAYDKLLRSKSIDSNTLSGTNLTVSEEWMFKLGDFGGIDKWESYELKLRQRDIIDSNKQLFRMIPLYNAQTKQTNKDLDTDRVIDITPADTRWVSKPGDNNLVFATRPKSQLTDTITEVIYEDLPTAGFVRLDQVDFTVSTVDDLYTVDISGTTEIDYWEQGINYKVGDVVRYEGYVYIAKNDHTSGETFILANWTISTEPELLSILVGNYDKGTWQVLRAQDRQLAISGLETYTGVTSGTTVYPTTPTLVTFKYDHNLQQGDNILLVNTNNTPSSDGFTTVLEVIDSKNILIEQVTNTSGTQGKAIAYMPVRFANETAMQNSRTDVRYNWQDGQLAFVDDATNIHGYAVFSWEVGVDDATFVPFQRFDKVESEQELIDPSKIYSIAIYDRSKNRVLLDLEVWDPYKGLIPKIADAEIDIKSPLDLAKYNSSSDPDQALNTMSPWGAKQVGTVWWDLSTVKYVNYESSSLGYRQQNWGKLFPGSTIDVYEWTESTVDPIAYNDAVDNGTEVDGAVPTGRAKVFSYNGFNLANWTTEEYVDELNVTKTKYYFWVKGKDSVPASRPERQLAVTTVANIIEDPATIGLPWFAPISTDAFIISNVKQLLNDSTTTLQIQLRDDETPAHSQWMLLREFDNNTGIPEWLHKRLKDSLVGYNERKYVDTWVTYEYGVRYDVDDIVKVGNNFYRVYRYFQPYEASVVTPINKKPMYKLADYTLLPDNKIELIQRIEVPSSRLNEFDRYGNRIRPTQQTWIKDRANARKNLIQALNDLLLEIDLVVDIPGWDVVLGTTFTRGEITYDLTKFWSYVNYSNPNYDNTIAIEYAVATEADLDTIANQLVEGDYVGVGTPVNGQYPVVFQRYSDQFVLLFRENGTIQFDETLFDSFIQLDIWDLGGWDFKPWDSEPSQELEAIFETFRSDIFIDDFQSYYNRLFFAMVKFIYSEQNNIDWIAKSTYLHVDNLEVSNLSQLPYYTEDKVEYFIDYLNEVKPYRSKLREVFDTRKVSDTATVTYEDNHSGEVHLAFNRTGIDPVNPPAGDGDSFLTPTPGWQNQVWGAVINGYEIPWDATLPAMTPVNRYLFLGSDFGTPASLIEAVLEGDHDYSVNLEGYGEELAPIFAGDAVEICVQTDYDTGDNYAYRMFKTINNQYEFSRIANSAKTSLAAPLDLEDTEIEVVDGTVFGGVDFVRQRPGVIFINGERIEFYRRSANTLQDIVRGTKGTGIKNHPIGTRVFDSLPREEIPVVIATPGNVGFNDPGKTLRESTNPLAVFITAKQGDLN